MNAQEATREMEEVQPLPALPYESADVKALQQQAAVLLQSLRGMIPKKEKAKAKPKAAPAAPEEGQGSAEDGRPKRRRTKSAAK